MSYNIVITTCMQLVHYNFRWTSNRFDVNIYKYTLRLCLHKSARASSTSYAEHMDERFNWYEFRRPSGRPACWSSASKPVIGPSCPACHAVRSLRPTWWLMQTPWIRRWHLTQIIYSKHSNWWKDTAVRGRACVRACVRASMHARHGSNSKRIFSDEFC